MSISPRLQRAHDQLREELRRAIRQRDACIQFDPVQGLYQAAELFVTEFERACGHCEIKSRAELGRSLTSPDTNYAFAIEKVAKLLGRKVVETKPGGQVPTPHSHPRWMRQFAATNELKPEQLTAVRQWEFELEQVEAECRKNRTAGCQWLLVFAEFASHEHLPTLFINSEDLQLIEETCEQLLNSIATDLPETKSEADGVDERCESGVNASGEHASESTIWFNATDAARYIGKSTRTVKTWIEEGKLTILDENRTFYKFDRNELDAHKEASEAKNAKKETK